ncbi:LA_1737 family protein [Leptospira kmetyi]|uniref:LA_1737 family protein n=1 Tax=Leptospira kmetyi TaxID=408139 RepID=UPI003EBF3171
MRNRILLLILLCLPGILFAQTKTQTEDPFDELVREKKEIFGSEKEEKYPIRLLIYDWEKWEGHSAWHLFWFIRKTDYPKYKQFRIFPLYNSIEAKSGKASLDYLFPIAGYRKVESEGLLEKTFLSPLYYNNTIEPVGGGAGYRESATFFWLGYNFSSSGPGFEKNFTMVPGFFPLFTRKTETLNGNPSSHMFFLPLLFFTKESSEESKTTLALFHWGRDSEKKYFHFFPLVHYTNYKTKEDYSFTFFPLYHQSKSNAASKRFELYSPLWFQEEERTSDSYSEFTFLPFPLLYRSKQISPREESSVFLLAPLALYFKDVGENVQFRNFLLFQWGKEKEFRFFRFLPLLYWSKTKDQADGEFTFFPFVFYKQNSYFNLFPILYYKKDSYFTLFPLYHQSYEGDNFTQYILPFIYRRTGKEDSETLILNTYWSSSKDELASFHFVPFWFYKKNEYKHLFPLYFSWEESKENSAFAGPLYYRSVTPTSSTNYLINTYVRFDRGELSAFTFFPLFYYKKNSYGHVFPVYFSWIDDDQSVNRAGPLFYQYRSADTTQDYYINTYYKRERGKGLTELVSFPFVFYKENSHLAILPFYYQSIDGDDFTQYYFLPIPMYRHNRKMESETLVLNAYWTRDAKGEYQSSTFFPFYFHKKNSYLNIPFLLYFQSQTETTHEKIAPLFYSYSAPNEDEFFLLGYHSYSSDRTSFNRMYPFYYSSREKDGSSFLGLGGLFYRWKDSTGETTTRTFLPLHYYQKNEYNIWFPFYFRFGGEDKNHFSFSPLHYRLRSPNVDRDWIVLYYSSENREEKTTSRFVAPLYFEWKNPESRGDIFLPAYLKYYEKNKNLELYFGGISISQTGGKFDASFKSSASGKEFYVDLDYSFLYNIFSVSLRKELSNPLAFFSDEKKEEPIPVPQANQGSKNIGSKKGLRLAVVAEDSAQTPPKEGSNFASYKKLARENSRNYFGWEALFGIASYQSGDDKSHFRILPLGWFTWGKNNKDRIFAFPLPLPTFWGTVGDESYRVVFPLFAEQRKGEDYTRAFGIFLFVMEQEKDRKEYSVLWPLIRYAKSKDEIAYRFFPFFTHKETGDRLETKSIFYYRSREKTGSYESSSFHGILFPFYHASEEIFTKNDSVSRGGYGLFFPFYYRNFEDRFVGGNQVYKERNIYTPLFLYSSLEDSSLKSKESFVLSPFYFASGSEKNILEKSYVSDLNLILPIPLVVWGREGEERYNFVAGLYRANSPESSTWNFLLLFGSTKTKKDSKEETVSSYVFPFYFGTTVTEGEVVKYKSKTIPLLYSGEETPESSESRYVVFFSHKSNPNAGYSKWVLPPFLYYEEEKNPYGQAETSIFTPLWFQKKVSPGQSKLKTSSDKKFFPIPLLATYESVTDEGMIRETSGWDWLFLANSETRRIPSIQKTEYDLKILLGGIFGYSSQVDPVRESVSWNLSLFYFRKVVLDKGVKKYSSNFVPIVHSSETTPDSEDTNWFLIFGNKSDQKTGYKRKMFLPVYYEKEQIVRKGYVDSTSFYFLFYQWKSVQEGKDANSYTERFYPLLPIPLLYTYENRIRDDKVRKDVWGFDWLFLANYKNTKYLHSGTESTSFKALLSLFGYEKNGAAGEQEFSSYLFPLFFYKSGEHKEYDSYRWFVPIVAYRSFNEKQGKISSHTNLFGILMNYKRDDDAGTKSFFFFPSIYYSNDSANKEKTFFVLPFLYSSSTGEDQYSFFLMGYYQSRSQWSNRYNFLYLFDLESSLTEQKKELTLFLGAFNGEFQKDKTRWGVFGGILMGYQSTPQAVDWNVLWIRYLNSPQEKIQNFLPVYRYSENREGYSFLAPPILTYHEKDVEGSLTLGGLGLLYYKNRSEVSKEESTKILGGLLFFSEKKAARGYQNYGVLGAPLIGGLLLNYEYEEDTGFEKTSVLKFVFSRTTYKGKTWNSYFGISSRLFEGDDEKERK